MERENRASAGGATGAYRRWEAPPEDVIVVSAGRPPRHLQQPQPQPSEGVLGPGQQQYPEPPEKVYYKTKLCEKYVTMGHCMYDDGCTFAHGRAELRPPLPAHGGVVWRRPPPAEQERARDYGGAGGGGGGVGRGSVCFMFREKRDCHYGDKCAFPHASAPGPGMRNHGEPKLTAARRSATPPARPFSAAAATPRGHGYGPASARAFQPVVPMRQLPEEDDGNSGPLTILSRRKTSGIYGDWPEEY